MVEGGVSRKICGVCWAEPSTLLPSKNNDLRLRANPENFLHSEDAYDTNKAYAVYGLKSIGSSEPMPKFTFSEKVKFEFQYFFRNRKFNYAFIAMLLAIMIQVFFFSPLKNVFHSILNNG